MKTPVPTLAVAVCLALLCAAPGRGQTVETDPLTCWWRSSQGAVRVGQPFSVVLTCAVVDTATVTVVADQSPLDAAVMQLPPFDVLSGTHPPDLRADDRRFFQYEYRLRLIGEDVLGRDLKLPDVKLTYRVQTSVNGAAAVEGRERTYVLPPMSIRIASLVPADAGDIRDASAETFGEIDARTFRATLLRTVAGVLFGLCALIIVLALARAFARRRLTRPAAERTIGPLAVLGAVRRELTDVGRVREQTGWTAPLANRLAAALRIIGGYALSRPATQTPVPTGPMGLVRHDGVVRLRAGLTGRRQVAVSSAATPFTLAQERIRLSAAGGSTGTGRAPLLEEVERALASATVAQYGRADALDDRALDDARAIGSRAVRELWIAQLRRKVTRVWSR